MAGLGGAGLSASNARDRREQCYRASELDLFPKRHVQMTTPHLNHFGVVRGLMQINHRLDHAGHASVGTQNLRSTTERPLPRVRKM